MQIDRAGRTWKYEYDLQGNLRFERHPPRLSSLQDTEYLNEYTYDDIDRPLTRTVAGRELSTADKTRFGVGVISYAYDDCGNGIGRLCTVTLPDGRLTTDYAYDAEGNAISTSRHYDVGGIEDTRVTSETFGPGKKIVEEDYADHGVGYTADRTRTVTTYDDRALPETMTWLPATAPDWLPQRIVAQQVRNGAGLVQTRTAPFNSVGGGWRTVASTFTYDKLTRVTSQTVRDQWNTVQAAQTLTYYGLDDPATLDHQLGALDYQFAYDYDLRHQLTSVSEDEDRFSASYDFTPAGKLASAAVSATPASGGNVVDRDVQYDYVSSVDPEAPMALVPTVGGTNLRSYSYDSVGNLKARIEGDPEDDATDTFVYDGDDQLRRATKWDGTTSTGVEEYYYDQDGHRFAVVTRDGSDAVTGVRLFLDDTELDMDPATGEVATAYAYLSMGTPVAKVISPAGGWSVDGPSGWYNNAASLELQYHGLADSTLLSIRPNLTVESGYIYGPYGEIIESAGTTSGLEEQRRRFNDKVTDDQTGLHYYGVRYYDDLALGWTQADPLYRFAPDAAWADPRRALPYTFSLNNPLRYVDPDGRDPKINVVLVDLRDEASRKDEECLRANVSDILHDAARGDSALQSRIDVAYGSLSDAVNPQASGNVILYIVNFSPKDGDVKGATDLAMKVLTNEHPDRDNEEDAASIGGHLAEGVEDFHDPGTNTAWLNVDPSSTSTPSGCLGVASTGVHESVGHRVGLGDDRNPKHGHIMSTHPPKHPNRTNTRFTPADAKKVRAWLRKPDRID